VGKVKSEWSDYDGCILYSYMQIEEVNLKKVDKTKKIELLCRAVRNRVRNGPHILSLPG
jgi:hypothetical protein